MGKDLKLNELEKKLVDLLSEGLPLVERPYQALAEWVGASEEEVLEALKGLLEKKVIRRVAALIRHNLSG